MPSPRRHAIIDVLPDTRPSIDAIEEYELRFINATIVWINEFPLSIPVSMANIRHPLVLYKLFKILLNNDDFEAMHISRTQYKSESDLFKAEVTPSDNVSIIGKKVLCQITYLERLVDNHITNYYATEQTLGPAANKRLLPFPYQSLHWLKLCIFEDHVELFKFCQLLVFIGHYTSKFSTFGPTYRLFIQQEDGLIITRFLNSLIQSQKSEDDQSENSIVMKSFRLKRGYTLDVSSSHEDDTSPHPQISPHSHPQYNHTSTITILEDEYNALKWENIVLGKAMYLISNSK